MALRKIPPWKKYKGERPDKSTLRRWRKTAEKYGRAKGARWACGVCKRPIGTAGKGRGTSGWFTLYASGAWRQIGKKRRLCYACWATLDYLIDHLEATEHRDHLPTEILAKGGVG